MINQPIYTIVSTLSLCINGDRQIIPQLDDCPPPPKKDIDLCP